MRVLQAIVGHQLPVYFINSVRSVRALAPDDDLLVVDNASGLPGLTAALEREAAADARIRLLTRTENDLTNAKVGGLYDAYREVLAHAAAGGYELLHLIQADMQIVWWDARAVDAAVDIFRLHPECVNVHTAALPRDRGYDSELRTVDATTREITGYGITDTGIFHLERWAQRGLRFGASEQGHSREYHRAGLRAMAHPVPPLVPIPWPAVVRGGAVRGREVRPTRPYLLRPLTDHELADLHARAGSVWLEDVCVPWGWSSLTPMSSTAPESIDWWVYRFRRLRAGDLRRALPAWTADGLDRGESRWRVQRRPRVVDLLLEPARTGLRRRRARRTG